MDIVEIENIFKSRDRQKIEMMARNILVDGRTHEFMKKLSQHAEKFNHLLSMTDPNDKEYLSLVYILADHLKEIKSGDCACSIVGKPMYNSPKRLEGILEIIEEKVDMEEYSIWTHTKCLACGKEYESKQVECGFGQKVIWNDYR